MNTSKDATLPAPTAAAPKDSAKKKKKDEESPEDKAFENFLAEVESDMRDEALGNIWKKYSAHILGVVILLVAGVFGYEMYASYITDRREQMALNYGAAVEASAAGNLDEALTQLNEIGDVSGEGYTAVARLAKASVLLDKGDAAGALAVYEDLAADAGADPIFRDIAVVLKAMHSIDTADPAALESELAPLAGPGQPFRYSALELAALAAAKQGAMDRAKTYLDEILGDLAAPAGIRTRAQDLASLYAAEGAPPVSSAPDNVSPDNASSEPAAGEAAPADSGS